MKIYSAPEGIAAPKIKGGMDFDQYNRDCNQYEKDVIEYCKKNSNHKHAGETISFSVADGCAVYIVFTPTKLIHLELGDAYHYSDIDKYKGADILKKIEQSKAMANLFGGKKSMFG